MKETREYEVRLRLVEDKMNAWLGIDGVKGALLTTQAEASWRAIGLSVPFSSIRVSRIPKRAVKP